MVITKNTYFIPASRSPNKVPLDKNVGIPVR